MMESRNEKQIVHLLVVEDDPNDVMFLKRAFDHLGIACQMSFAIDGQEAIEVLSCNTQNQDSIPTHMVLDLKLPKRSGVEVLKWVRKHPRLSRLPVVVFSSSQEESDMASVLTFGIDSFQVKPVGFADHLRVVGSVARSWGLL